MKFKQVVCGGTFDHFHRGHRQFLDFVLSHGEKVTIGVTDEEMIKNKEYANEIESYRVRRKNVAIYISSKDKKIKIQKIHSLFGPTLSEKKFDAIVVTDETKKGADLINRKRIELGMEPLKVIIAPYAYAEDGERISSKRIREGGIDREGNVYYRLLISRDKLVMPESLRLALRLPLGCVISSFSSLPLAKMEEIKGSAKQSIQGKSRFHIAIGDMVTYHLKKIGIIPSISVIDGKSQRKALKSDILQEITEKDSQYALNEKGAIGRGAIEKLSNLLILGHTKAPQQLFIQGEEDLLTLPAILLSPLGANVWYGQRRKGAICVKVTEKKKQKVYNLLKRFV